MKHFLIRIQKTITDHYEFLTILALFIYFLMFYYVGYSRGPEDERPYLNLILAPEINNTGLFEWVKRYKVTDLNSIGIIGSHLWDFRFLVWFPPYLISKVLPPSEFTMILWGLVTMIICGFYVYSTSRKHFGKPAGIFSCATFFLIPGVILNSGRLCGDLPFILFTFLAWVKWIEILEEKNTKLIKHMKIGIFIGLAYLTKYSAWLILPAVLLLSSLPYYKSVRVKDLVISYFKVLFFFFVVIFAESILYYSFTGHHFLRSSIFSHVEVPFTQMRLEGKLVKSSFGPIELYLPNGDWWTFSQLKSMLELNPLNSGIYMIRYWGLHFWLFFASVVISFLNIMLKRGKLNKTLMSAFLIVIGVYLLIDPMWLIPSFESSKLILTAGLKNSRYSLTLAPFIAFFIGFCVSKIKFPWISSKLQPYFRNGSIIMVMLTLLTGSVLFLNRQVPFFRGSLNQLKESAQYARKYVPNKNDLYVEFTLESFYRSLLWDKDINIKGYSQDTRQSSLCSGYLVLGGRHGTDRTVRHVVSRLPDFLIPIFNDEKNAPADWELIALVPGVPLQKDSFMKFYKLNDCPNSETQTYKTSSAM